mgnify:CR=1 FL=1
MKIKKMAIMALLCAGLMIMPGCQVLKESEIDETVESTALPIFSIGELASVDDYEFSVSDIYSFSATAPNGEPQDYIVVNVAYTNLTDQSQKIGRRDIHLYLDNEEVFISDYRNEFQPIFSQGLMFNEESVNPGRTKRGYIVYRVYRSFSSIDVSCGEVIVNGSSFSVNPLNPIPDEVEETVEPTEETTVPTPVETAPPETEAPPPETIATEFPDTAETIEVVPEG